jgi:Fic family protein
MGRKLILVGFQRNPLRADFFDPKIKELRNLLRDYCMMYDIIYTMYKPTYQITTKILSDISEISEIKAIIERSKVLPVNEAQLRRQAIVRMAHTSTSIEGNRLAEYQVDKVLSGMSVNADERSILEVKNYQKALQEMEKIVEESKVVTIEQILKLHQIMTKGLVEPEKNGHFRKGDIYIVDDLGNGQEKLRYQGPPPEKVAFLVNELVNWLVQAEKDDLHPVLRAALFNVQFVTIHPFTDGNGRMTRLLTTMILYMSSWDFRKIIVLEDYYNRDRQSYYNALNMVQGNHYQESNDVTTWLEYFTEGFVCEARKVVNSINAIGFGKIEGSSPIFLDRDEIKLLDFITTTGQLTSSDVEDVLGVPKRTAQFKIKKMVDKGLLKVEGSGPNTHYLIAG